MTGKTAAYARTGAAILIAITAAGAHAQFVPPYGYSGGGPRPAVATPSDPDAPRLTPIPDATVATLIQVDPAYSRDGSVGHAKIVGAFAIAETGRSRFVKAWASGFLPVTLSFSDGRCYALRADYEGDALSNARLSKAGCERPPPLPERPLPSPPPGRSLRLIETAWGYGAWMDERAKTTIITAPGETRFQPLFTAHMATSAIMAMNSPDSPGGNVTLVGRIEGRLAAVTLEVGY